MVGHTHQYNSSLRVARSLLDKGEIGRLTMIVDTIYAYYNWEKRAPWFLDSAKSGGGRLDEYRAASDRSSSVPVQKQTRSGERLRSEKPRRHGCGKRPFSSDPVRKRSYRHLGALPGICSENRRSLHPAYRNQRHDGSIALGQRSTCSGQSEPGNSL